MQDDIKALVETTIQTRILQAFKDAPEAIDALVKAALGQEVDQYGGKPDYSSRQRMPYLTWLVGDQIRQIARQAVQDIVKERAPEIKVAVAKTLTADKIVDGVTDSILGTMERDYRLSVKFAPDKDDD